MLLVFSSILESWLLIRPGIDNGFLLSDKTTSDSSKEIKLLQTVKKLCFFF